jgi:acetylornithine deacetylase/succinyl-diaminopimelate desuccinylase-like protein
MHLVALLLLREQGVPLRRDIIFLAVSDEEQGGACGAEWLAREHAGMLDAEYLLGEGGGGLLIPNRGAVWLPSYAEKGILWLKLSCRGDGGHASMPKGGGAVEKMARAVGKLHAMEPEVFVTDEAERNLKAMAERLGAPWSLVLKNPRSRITMTLLSRAARSNPFVRALMCSTLAVTGMKAGAGENQLPESCEATLDCRIHPSDSAASFRRRVEREIGGEGITVSTTLESGATRSSVDTELYRVISEVLQSSGVAKTVVPALFPGTTDSRFFRPLGITCYGLLPVMATMEDLEPHKSNERIKLSDLESGCRHMYTIVKRICTGG